MRVSSIYLITAHTEGVHVRVNYKLIQTKY